MTSKGKSSRSKVPRHRERLREQGLRPIQIWVRMCGPRLFARKLIGSHGWWRPAIVRVRIKRLSTPYPTEANTLGLTAQRTG